MNRLAILVFLVSPFLAAPSCGQEEPAAGEGAAQENAEGDCPMKKGHGHHGPAEDHAKEYFAKMDADGSGVVTLEEFEGHVKNEKFAKMDADGSGGVSVEEAVSHWKAKKFEKADADGNGELTLEEVVEYKKAKHAK